MCLVPPCGEYKYWIQHIGLVPGKLKGMNFSAFEVVLHNFMYVCIDFSAVSLDPGWNARHDMRRQNTLMADVWIFF